MSDIKDLVHYIVHKCSENPAELGTIRLYKTLWFADVSAYHATGESITGEKYIKQPLGPVPQRIYPALGDLVREEKIRITEPDQEGAPRLYRSLTDPDTSSLSDDDRQCVDLALRDMLSLSAKEASQITHDEVWEAANMEEEMPLYATLGESAEITPEMEHWAQEMELALAQHGSNSHD